MNSPISKYPHLQKLDALTAVRGLFIAKPISVERRLPLGKTWADYFGHYQQQRWGVFDSNSCWVLGGMINEAQDQLELLYSLGMFSPVAMKFFNDNGFRDADGDFSLSEQFIEILGKRRTAGGWSETAWQLLYSYGCIPRAMLTYTESRAASFGYDLDAIANDYFNPAQITQKMLDLGQEFRKHVNVAYQKIGTAWQTPELQILKGFLQMTPLAIGIPIPADVSQWNAPYVQYDGGRQVAHEVELYGINDKGEYLIFDQYEPHLKILSADYYIVYCTMGVLYATPQAAKNPVPQSALGNAIWSAIGNYFNNAWKSLTLRS